MFSFLDYWYNISLSIVGKSKIVGQEYAERRAHRAVIMVSYMLGLLLSSATIYVLAHIISPAKVGGTLFALVFTITLLAPYCLMKYLYIVKNRVYTIVDMGKRSYDPRAVFMLAYLSCHIVFLLIIYLAGHG